MNGCNGAELALVPGGNIIMNTRLRSLLCLSVSAISLISISDQAFAQETTSGRDRSGNIEELVVTAEKR
jgi:hypothetical protein